MAFILFDTHSSDEHFNSDCDIGVLFITPELHHTVARAHRAFLTLKTTLQSIDEIVLFETECLFLPFSETITYFGQVNLPKQGSFQIVKQANPNLPSSHFPRTDCIRLHIDANDAWWQALVYHTSVRISTSAIPIKTLLNISEKQKSPLQGQRSTTLAQ